MENQHIPFKRQRELGDIITVTFRLVRENYKSLLRNIYKNAGPFFILLTMALAYYTYAVTGSPLQILTGGTGNFIIPFFVFAIALLLFYSAFYGTVLHYISSYVNNEGEIIDSEVRKGVQKDYFNILGLSVISSVLIIAGLMLFVIPGIYLMVPLSLSLAVLVFKRMSISDSISYSFQLVKDHWWITFLTIIVIWLLIYVISLVFQIPVILYMIVKAITVAQEGSVTDPASYADWVFITLNVIASLVQYLLSAITIIGISFIYFNLNEHKNLTGAYETIENLGE